MKISLKNLSIRLLYLFVLGLTGCSGKTGVDALLPPSEQSVSGGTGSSEQPQVKPESTIAYRIIFGVWDLLASLTGGVVCGACDSCLYILAAMRGYGLTDQGVKRVGIKTTKLIGGAVNGALVGSYGGACGMYFGGCLGAACVCSETVRKSMYSIGNHGVRSLINGLSNGYSYFHPAS